MERIGLYEEVDVLCVSLHGIHGIYITYFYIFLVVLGVVLLAASLGLCFLWANGRFGTTAQVWVLWASVPAAAAGLTLINIGSKHRNIGG